MIRGSKGAIESPSGFLSKEEYCQLPGGRTAYSGSARAELYDDFIQPFHNSLTGTEWDDLHLAREILTAKNFVPIYRHIYIDEVQDLTEINQWGGIFQTETGGTDGTGFRRH